jgi:hypothetical protein
MDFGSHTLKLSIRRTGEAPVPFFSGVVACYALPPEEPLPFAAGQELIENKVMFWNDKAGDLAFPRPGRYTISGTMFVAFDAAGDAIEVEAAPVPIDVSEPEGADAQVLNALGSLDRLIGLLRDGAGGYCKGERVAGCYDDLRALVRKFPASAYAPYIAFDLADTLTWPHNKSKNIDLAVDLYSEFLKRWPDHPLAADATRFGAFALKESGKQEQAVEWMDQFERGFPERRSELNEMRRRILLGS